MSTSPTRSDAYLTSDPQAIQGHVDRLQSDFDSLRKQLHHAQRLASLGTMAAMTAHEYNNLMTPIVTFAKYALDKDDPELLRSSLEKCLKQALQAVQFSDRILNVAADQDKGPTRVAVDELVRESVECLGRDLSKDNIGLTLEIEDDLQVRVDAARLKQVLINLIQNARQAMLGRRGRLTVKAWRVENDVHLSIADIGSGIRSEDLPRIFEPFFTTKSHADKPDKRGIGLGLSVCNDIITDHDGRIEVESRFGHGTTFTLVLPFAAS